MRQNQLFFEVITDIQLSADGYQSIAHAMMLHREEIG